MWIGTPLARRAVAAAVLAASVTCAWPGEPAAARRRPLLDVLREMRLRGLNLIYSTAVVGPDVVVTLPETAAADRALLDEILPPVGLEARDGPNGAVLIVASEPARVRGTVVSSGLGRPVARASVRIPGTTTGTVTRPDGGFELDRLRAGSVELRVEAAGFEARSIGPLRLAPGASVDVRVALDPRPGHVEEIVVTPSRHALTEEPLAASVVLDPRESGRFPEPGDDASRIVQFLPGMASTDASAALRFRGSLARDVAVVLDGLELYAPYHLDALQQPYSVVDADVVRSIEFFGGGYTAERGDRHGGFVDVATEAPSGPDTLQLRAGTVNSGLTWAAARGRGSVLASARAWYPGGVRDPVELGEPTLAPRFGDAYVKLTLPLAETVVSVHALYAYDRVAYAEPDGNEQLDMQTQSGTAWLRVVRSWSPAVDSTTVVSVGRLERFRRGLSSPEDAVVRVDDDRTVVSAGLRHDMTWRVSERRLVRGGFLVRPLGADYRYAAGPPSSPVLLSPTPRGTSLGAYAAYRHAWSDALATEVGLRWDRQVYTDDGQLSPRLNAIWRPGRRSEIRVGVGRFWQSQRIDELRVEDGETAFPPAELSRQVELTWERRPASGPRLRVDAYDRRLTRIQPRFENLFNPAELFPETESDRVRIAPDAARMRGVELSLGSKPGAATAWSVGWALASAADRIGGRDVPRAWDQRHAVRVLVARPFAGGWIASVGGAFHSGWPTTPVAVTPVSGGGYSVEPVLDERNTARLPAYVRFDVKIGRSLRVGNGRLSAELEILNLTDRANVCCIDGFSVEPRADGTADVRSHPAPGLGFTPYFRIGWTFGGNDAPSPARGNERERRARKPERGRTPQGDP